MTVTLLKDIDELKARANRATGIRAGLAGRPGGGGVEDRQHLLDVIGHQYFSTRTLIDAHDLFGAWPVMM